ncbi:MAG: hypothetical protein JSV05_02690 [Candidatus Bathyarchaeota archaeon]|nr:MAG: hypothetical protein JSV05_02690 [Candidatus Bathyarchaeota archaeon]
MSEEKAQEKEKPVKLEGIAEETGELIGKGIKKTWNVMESFCKGLADTFELKTDQKNGASTCSYCGAALVPQGNYCSRCGKKL